MRLLARSALVTAAAAVSIPLAARQLSGDTENQFTAANTCNGITVLFARGTTESGNVGTLTGPPFFQALASAAPGGADGLTVQGVDYAADIPGFLEGGDPAGSQTLATLIGQVWLERKEQ